MKKEIIKSIIFQGWGTFYGTTMIVCGFKDYQEIVGYLHKKKYYDWEEALKNKPEEFIGCHFSKWIYKDKKYSMLFLKDWKSDVNHYKILAHELVHAVQFCMKDFLDVQEEFEAVAYQHSYLFEEIANELNKVYDNKR